MNNWRFLLGSFAVAASCLMGCNKSQTQQNGGGDGHAHAGHPEPKSLTEAMTLIKEARGELAAAYAAGDSKEADNAFHEIHHALEAMPKLIETSGMERYDATDAEAAVASLSTALEKVHPPHDGSKVDPATYEGAKADIDSAITALEGVVNKGSGGSVAE
jgi:hypothetical protein